MSLEKPKQINNKTPKVEKQNKTDRTTKGSSIRPDHSPFDSKLETLGFNLFRLVNIVSTVWKNTKQWPISKNQTVPMAG
jgi:hypothetical protein